MAVRPGLPPLWNRFFSPQLQPLVRHHSHRGLRMCANPLAGITAGNEAMDSRSTFEFLLGKLPFSFGGSNWYFRSIDTLEVSQSIRLKLLGRGEGEGS